MPDEGVSMSIEIGAVVDAAKAPTDGVKPDEGVKPTGENKPDEGVKPDEALGEAGIKALHAERDARKVAEDRIKDYEARLKEFEDRDKTEQEKAAEHAAQLAADLDAKTASLAALELNLARVEVAHAKGVPAELVPRLRGETREELEADADALLEIVGKRDAEAPRKPKPVGSLGTGGDARLTPAEQFAVLMESNM